MATDRRPTDGGGEHHGATRLPDRRTAERADRRPVDVPEVLRSPTDNGDQRPTATDDRAETIALSVPPSARGDGSSLFLPRHIWATFHFAVPDRAGRCYGAWAGAQLERLVRGLAPGGGGRRVERGARGGFCSFLRGVMGVGGGDVQRRASRARRRVPRRALNTPTGRGKRLCVDRTTKMHRFKINRATSQSLGEHHQRAHTVRTHERRRVACAPGRALVDPTGREVRLCGNG